MPERYAFRTTKDSADRVIDDDLAKYPKENGVQSSRIRELLRAGLHAEALQNLHALSAPQTMSAERLETMKRQWQQLPQAPIRNAAVSAVAPAGSAPDASHLAANMLEDDYT